jgi:hypothetical protein
VRRSTICSTPKRVGAERKNDTAAKEEAMKFMCLGYGAEKNWDAMTKREQDAFIEECFAYDDPLFKDGHWIEGGQALQSARHAKTLRWKNGKVVVTDGPFTETKEQLGGTGVLEARDMDHAIALISKHPGLRLGPFEIRPIDEESLKRQMASDAEWRGKAAAVPKDNPASMKFASLGYVPGNNWDEISESERDAMIEQCIAFDAARRKDGQWLGGIALQGAGTAKTLRLKAGKVAITDGPYAETKEWLGGVVVLQIKDMNHAVELLSRHPALPFGISIELRPIDEEMNARWESRQAGCDKKREEMPENAEVRP